MVLYYYIRNGRTFHVIYYVLFAQRHQFVSGGLFVAFLSWFIPDDRFSELPIFLSAFSFANHPCDCGHPSGKSSCKICLRGIGPFRNGPFKNWRQSSRIFSKMKNATSNRILMLQRYPNLWERRANTRLRY